MGIMQTWAYLRVSTAMQADANGANMQRDAIARWLEYAGVSDARWFEDAGVSGLKASRPGWDAMLTDVRNTQGARTIVVYDLSRAGRSLRHLLAWVEEMNGTGVRLVFTKENIDTTTPTGRLLLSVMGAIAEFEAENIRERVKCGIRAAIDRRGGRWGRAPKLGPEAWQTIFKAVSEAPKGRERRATINELAAMYHVSAPLIYRRFGAWRMEDANT